MRVLYLSPFAAFGGATRSLIELMRAFDPDLVQMHAIVATGVTQKGWFPPSVELSEVPGLVQWDNTRFGYYRGFRWLILLREIARIPVTRRVFRALRQAHAENPFDLIHCNEITLIPAAIMARRALGIPLVIHVRSLQAQALTPRRSARITRALAEHADAIVAIDQAVARTIDADLEVDLIYNSMALPEQAADVANHDRPLTFGIIGSLALSKGVLEMLQACALLKRRGVPFRLLVAGENVRSLTGIKGRLLKLADLSRDIEAEVREFVAQEGLEGCVEMLGFVQNVEEVYARLDVLCFPSRLDAPGRPVFEAALHGVPSIVAQREPTNDVIDEGVTGLRIVSPDPELIADAMEAMHADRDGTHAMGKTARMRALARFDSRLSAADMTALYRRVLARHARSADPFESNQAGT